MARGIATLVSAPTVRRWLDGDALKPWQHRSWIFITDPGFRAKAQRVLDLYARTWQGVPLGEDEYVISADEKTAIQARCRGPPPPDRPEPCASTTPTAAAAPWPSRPPTVMAQVPYASAKRVFWIVDNGSSHRGQKAADRLTAAFPNAVMVHTPVHASWLNQVKIYFTRRRRSARVEQIVVLDQGDILLATCDPVSRTSSTGAVPRRIHGVCRSLSSTTSVA